MSKHLFMHHGGISDGGGDGDPAGPWGGGDGGGDEVETETEVEVMEMKMIWILLLGGLSKPDLAEKNGPAGKTDGGTKEGGKTVPTLKASCTNTMAPFTVGTRSRKTGAEKVRENVWVFGHSVGPFFLKNGKKQTIFMNDFQKKYRYIISVIMYCGSSPIRKQQTI